MEPYVNLDPDEDQVFFEDYKPPARDAIHLPKYILYMLIASLIVFSVLYAIIGHLIKDLMHDLADCLFGKEPEEEIVSPWQCTDKFQADWCPETSPELEELARAEQIEVLVESRMGLPAIWVISDARESRPPRTGPRVAFGKFS